MNPKGKTNNKGKQKEKVEVIQANLQKAKMAQIEISKSISKFNKSNQQFIIFIQEPMVTNSKACLLYTSDAADE